MAPPTQFVQECRPPVLSASPITNKDLAQYVLDLKFTLQECNDDKAALRAWVQFIKGHE